MSTQSENALANLVKERVARQSGERTRKQIALAAGFESDDTLKKIEAGTAKLPLDYAVRLADELGLDRREFVFLAMRQFFAPDFVDLLEIDPELREIREVAASALLALQVEVTLIGSQARVVEDATVRVLEAAANIATRQHTVARALKEHLDLVSGGN